MQMLELNTLISLKQRRDSFIKNYILAPNNLKVGDDIVSGRAKEIKVGNCMPLSDIPDGTEIHNIELAPKF